MRSRRTIFVLVLSVVVLLLSAIPGKATFSKLYTLNAPVTIAGGGERTFSVTYEGKSLFGVGSSNLSVPSEFTGVSVVSFVASKGTATANGNTIEIRGMSLGNKKKAVLTLKATVPCGPAAYTWSAITKSSSSFGGGADFSLTQPSNLTTTATGECPPTELRFVNQPASAAPDASIGDPIQVEAVDSHGNVVTSFTGQVTLTPSGGPGSLPSGTDTATAVNGVATFSGLSVDQVGIYMLTASSDGLTSATSDSFTIAEGDLDCNDPPVVENEPGQPAATIVRVENVNGSPCVPVLYSLRTRIDDFGTQFVLFEKDLSSQLDAQFEGTTVWELEVADLPVPVTQISYDGGATYHDMLWCLADGTNSAADGFPDLPGDEFWCITSQSSVLDELTGKIQVTETDFGIGDPFKKR